jgi:lipopolysaccharide transport system permease protein
MSDTKTNLPITRIEPVAPLGIIDLREVYDYRDLLFFMVWRGVKVGYAQSVGGYLWAVIQPAMQILLFTVVFGGLLGLDADGRNYLLLVTVAIIPWGYMVGTLDGTSNCLVINSGMLAKIYFPRAIFLLNPVLGNLIPFFISLALIAGVMIFYQVALTTNMLMLPVVFLFMLLTPLSIGIWLSSLAIRFRDVKIIMSMITRMLIYTVPVMYQSDKIPPQYRDLYVLNPFVGVIEGYRSALLGEPFMWDSMLSTVVITTILLVSGSIYFRRMERIIVDVI